MTVFFKALLKSLFPQRCAYCGKVVSADEYECGDCKKILPRIEGKICSRCGRTKKECSCNGEKYFLSQAAPFCYEGVVRRGLHVFKFRNGRQNSEAYCHEMAETVRQRYADKKFDYVVPVPMTKKSVRRRGYNQVEILAEGLAELLGIEFRNDIIFKIYETEKQHGISYILRKGNLTGVFDVPEAEKVRDKSILLCDDISTSGETFNECAKMLWLADASEICCISLALTNPRKKNKSKK